MFFKKPRHRVFDYPPRFYDPSKDENERRKRKLKFSSNRSIKSKKKSPIIWIAIIAMILYLLIKFGSGV